jgi:hypothetical protein
LVYILDYNSCYLALSNLIPVYSNRIPEFMVLENNGIWTKKILVLEYYLNLKILEIKYPHILENKDFI